jgi:PAS domain S-box-containing protein
MSEAVIATDDKGLIVFMNPVAETLTGWKETEALGKDLMDVFHSMDEETQTVLDSPVTMVFRKRGGIDLPNRILLRDRDGTKIPVDASAIPMSDDRAHISGVVLAFHGMSERKRLEHTLRQRAAELVQINHAKDEFIATISHELRAPLNSMLGWAHLLRTGNLDQAGVARALETIERNAKSQARLVEDLLDVSCIITGKLRLDTRPIELAPLIEAVIDTMRPAADAKGLRLESVIGTGAGLVSGDPDRLRQVLCNLLSNAIKFTRPGGHVKVRLRRMGSHVEIIVSDTGQGIRANVLPFVFDRFRQGESTGSRGGLGLGLAIARHLVELHGGTLRAESPGEGQAFTVQLPLVTAHIEAAGPGGPTSRTD